MDTKHLFCSASAAIVAPGILLLCASDIECHAPSNGAVWVLPLRASLRSRCMRCAHSERLVGRARLVLRARQGDSSRAWHGRCTRSVVLKRSRAAAYRNSGANEELGE